MSPHGNLLRISLTLLLLLGRTLQPLAYRVRLDIGNPAVLCPGNGTKCADGKPHYLCQDNAQPKCSSYKEIKMTNMMAKIFVDGHNGIRNKVADDFRIANMNLVHWSRELAIMAQLYLQECTVAKDQCLTIGERVVPVQQNHRFQHGLLSSSWPARVVRHWYLEVGYKSTYDHFLEERKKGQMENFTQMTWPLVEFVGCAAAAMRQGHFFVCFYHPPYETADFEKHIVRGKPCTKCHVDRSVCSRTFTSLCGLDLKVDVTSHYFRNQNPNRMQPNIRANNSELFLADLKMDMATHNFINQYLMFFSFLILLHL